MRGIDGLIRQYDNVPDLCESEGPCLQMKGRRRAGEDLRGYSVRLSRDTPRKQFLFDVQIAPPKDSGFPSFGGGVDRIH